MAQPPRYSRDFGFTDWSQSRPDEPLPGDRVDSEFDAVETTLDATLDNLALLQRDDGELANETVGMEQLKPELIPQLGDAIGLRPGPEGPAGPALPGPAGVAGPQGDALPWLVGSGVPSNAIGVVDQLYLNADSGDVYEKTQSGWVAVANIRGPAGVPGAGGGVSDHGALTGLADADHPISAVQGLQAALTSLTSQITALGSTVNNVYRQPEPPAGAGLVEGDLWFDTDNANLMHYWTGSAWVDVSDSRIAQASQLAGDAITLAAGAQATADGKVTTFYAATAPAGAEMGDLWFNTALGNAAYRWNGSSWVLVQDSSIAAALSAANTAQATADGKIVTFYQPTAPAGNLSSVGDIWFDTDDGNHQYRYNGSTWVSVKDAAIAAASAAAAQALSASATAIATADGKIEVFYQASAPSGAGVGDLWIRTSDRQMFRWNGSQWVSVQDAAIVAAFNNANLAIATADGKIRSFFQTTPPTGLVAGDVGDLWFDTDDYNRPYRWTGSSWVDNSPIQGVSGGVVTQPGVQAAIRVRAWARFYGTSVAYFTRQFNFSAITKIGGAGTGNYQFTFATPMPNRFYAVVSSATRHNDVDNPLFGGPYDLQTTGFKIRFKRASSDYTDTMLGSVLVFGTDEVITEPPPGYDYEADPAPPIYGGEIP